MQRYTTPISEEKLAEIISRPKPLQLDAASVVAEIFNTVRVHGDAALLEITERFDRAKLNSLTVSHHEVKRAYAAVPKELKEAIAVARKNIERFHTPQLQAPQTVETMPGVLCWRRSIPISPIGFYIPGGSAALFSSALMMGIPAAIAGCSDIVACTPPDSSGNVNPAVLYTLTELGITKYLS
jgi:histidinol dehydrogenase